MADTEPSYIDYEAFLDPTFLPSSFANTLVTNTNNVTDTPLDLSTPLSRVLFDLQEIDTHIHALTTKSALPLFEHTRDRTDAADRVLHDVEAQVKTLTEGYERLEKDVLKRWEGAEDVRVAAEKSWATLRLARGVGRCLVLGRQLEGQLAEVTGRGGSGGENRSSAAMLGREDHRALVRAANTLLHLRRMFGATGVDDEGSGLDRVRVVRTLRSDLVVPAENTVKARSQQIVNKFSLSTLSADTSNGGASTPGGSQPQSSGSSSTFAQIEDAKSRMSSAITTLYLLSPTSKDPIPAAEFHPELLLATLQGYIHTSLTSSVAGLSRALSMLPTLERTLAEVSSRCQSIIALESLLETLKPPVHPFLTYTTTNTSSDKNGNDTSPPNEPSTTTTTSNNLLTPLLNSLDTSSLPSYFWRSLASSLSPRVQEIVSRGGVSARTLKSNRERLREEVRGCVIRGSRVPGSGGGNRGGVAANGGNGNWEREAAVMVGAVVGVLGR